jgi:hypothetical protein
MLNGFFRQKLLRISNDPAFQRRSNESVEQKSSVDQEQETEDLQPFEGFPAEKEGDYPDKQGSTGVDCGSGCRGDGTGD